MKLTFEVLWARGSIVYLKTDPDQHQRILTGYKFLYSGTVIYLIQFVNQETEHYECEISDTKNNPINHL